MPKSPSNDLRILQTLWSETVHRELLPNGLTFILKPDHSAALCSVQAWVKTGSIHEGALLGGGLSHYLEHMLFKGTTHRGGREISEIVQSHGGYINAYTTFDRTVYYIDMPSEHIAVAVEVLSDAVFNSTLPADEVAKEKQVILREIDMTLDEPDQRLGQALFETAFREHPYRHPIIGHRAVFEGVTRDDLLAYYRARYVPNNVVLVVVGNFDTDKLRATVASTFGAVPRGRLAPVVLADEPLPLATREAVLFEDVQLTRAGLGWQIPGLTHPDTPAFDLLASILGHGNSSILWHAVREKRRLVHSIDAYAWNPGTVGLFYVPFICEPSKQDAARAAVFAELRRLAERGVPPAMLRKAIRQSVADEVNARKTMSGQASRLGVAEIVVGALSYSRHYFELLTAVTVADIRRVTAAYFKPSLLTSVSLNPRKQPAAGASAPVKPELHDFETVEAAGGATLLLDRDGRLPSVHLRLAFGGGCAQEPATARGALGLLATMLGKDTRKRSAAGVARAIEAVGGTFTNYSGSNTFGLAIEVLPGDLALALEILGDAAVSPAFNATTLEKERDAALAALADDEDDIVTFARNSLRRTFFGTHPLSLDTRGNPEGVRAVTPAVLRALHRQLVVSGNAVLAVAGDFDPVKWEPHFKKLLARLPRGGRAPDGPSFAGPVRGKFEHKKPRQQAVVLHGFTGPGIRGKDFYVSEVADEIFSGMASNLFERVREKKGLAYFVRSSRVIGLDSGMFSFLAGTSPDHAAEVLAEFEAEVRRVKRGGVAEAEFVRCQTRLKAAKRMGMQSNGSRAMQAALNALYNLPVNDWRNYDARIDEVTRADLRDFARRRFVDKHRVQVVVRP
ncbi:MAG TPA: pitrilysin family protein [Opitutaceae bacterium]